MIGLLLRIRSRGLRRGDWIHTAALDDLDGALENWWDWKYRGNVGLAHGLALRGRSSLG